MTADSTAQMLKQSEQLLNRFRKEIEREAPVRIHSSDVADDGAPQWHPEFTRWLVARESDTSTYIPDAEHRLRTTRALRKLRRTSVRGFEVTWRVFGGEPVEGTVRWLNERARRNNIPLPAGKSTHYSNKDGLVILFASLCYMDWCY